MTHTDCITSLLAALDQQIWAARETSREACHADRAGNRNLAIGTLLPAEQHLANANDLLRVILALHRTAAPGLMVSIELSLACLLMIAALALRRRGRRGTRGCPASSL